jgi:phosphoglycolate phosphatase
MKRRIPLPRAVLFDLDGTLSDSLPDIAWALNEARAQHGFPPVSQHDVGRWVGAGAAALIARSVGVAEDDPRAIALLASFLAIYEAHACDRSRLFPGVRELLEELRRRGVRTAVTTNKPAAACTALLEGLGIAKLFDAVVTPEIAGAKKPDPRFMAFALTALGVAAKEALVVGDGVQDLQAAQAAAIPCVGILGGYAGAAALRACRPDWCVQTIGELAKRLDLDEPS